MLLELLERDLPRLPVSEDRDLDGLGDPARARLDRVANGPQRCEDALLCWRELRSLGQQLAVLVD